MNSEVFDILSKLGPSEESLYYWGLYRNTPSEKFAVLKISGSCIAKSLEGIAEDLSILNNLGLIPTVTYGWGNTLTERLKELGIESRFIDGDRYTDEEIMKHVTEIANKTGSKLHKAIISKGGKAKFIDHTCRVIIAKDKEDPRYGKHNGDIVAINTEPILQAISQGVTPIVSPIGISEDGSKLYNLNSAVVGANFVKVIDPIKYIMGTSSKGVLDNEDNLINEIILRKDYEQLVANGILSGGMLKNVNEATQSIDVRENSDDKSVQIVNPDNLLFELFTYKGAGTYIRKGYIIIKKSIPDIDRDIVELIIQNSLGEQLKNKYFRDAAKKNAIVYLERNYKGVGIIIPSPVDGVGPYMDIFAVSNDHVRKGVGTDIITATLETQNTDKPKLSWRSKAERPANKLLYFNIAHGHQKFIGIDGHLYNGFWIGHSIEEAVKPLDYMKQKPLNFK